MKDKVVVITGAGGVLCSCFARAMAEKGAKIALLDIRLEAAEAAAAKIVEAGGIAKGYHCNVLDRTEVEAVHRAVLDDFGKCDILINGAGGNSPRCTTLHENYVDGDELTNDISTFFNIKREDFDFVFGLNITGVLIPTQVFAPDMLGRDGVIVNISSMNAYRPLTKIPAYSAAKAGVSNLTEWLAVHFAPSGIRVNAIAPGFFVTDQNRALLYTPEGEPTQRTNKILCATPMGRFGKPEELCGALLWLCDNEAAGFVTGIVVPVDGGFSAYSGV